MDTSRNFALGLGGYCNTDWMSQKWDRSFMESAQPSIEYLELYAVTAGVLAWIHRFSNKRVVIFTDNKSVKYMINHNTSGCKNCMVLIRILVLESMIHNIRIYTKHVRSKLNAIADALSRMQWSHFARLT